MTLNRRIRLFFKSIIPKALQPTEIYTKEIRRRSGMKVIAGPFVGMKYVDRAVGSTVQPKMLGIYERELIDVVERTCKIEFDTIIDIGAAEGYYCIGMALRNPQARNIAFEMNPIGREMVAEMARLNGVEKRVQILGACDLAGLKSVLPLSGRCLIICDVEGFENVLLDPKEIPELARMHVFVELHDMFVAGITETIRSRFEPTHKIETIKSVERSTDEYPYRSLFRTLTPKRWLIPMVSEYRLTPMNWFWMTPK